MSNTILIILIFLVLLVNVAFLVIFLRKKDEKEKPADDIGLKLILQQVNELARTMDTKMGESTKMMNESVRSQFGESAKLIREVTQGLTKLDETNKQVVSFADQLQ